MKLLETTQTIFNNPSLYNPDTNQTTLQIETSPQLTQPGLDPTPHSLSDCSFCSAVPLHGFPRLSGLPYLTYTAHKIPFITYYTCINTYTLYTK